MNPFLSRSWLEAWKQTSAVGHSLLFFEAGETFGVVTLSSAFRIYANGGINKTNLMDSSRGGELLTMVTTRLHRGVLLVFDVPQSGHLARVFGQLGARYVPQYPAPLIRLEPSFQRYTERQFSSSHRREFARCLRRLEAMGHLQFRVYERREDRSEALPLLDRFFALLTERFEEDKRQYNFYVTSHGQDFIRNVVTDLLGAGVILFVWTLDGVPISFSLCYVVDKRLIYVVPAYDSAFSKCGLGLLHLWKTVAWSFDHGFEILDLSKGTAPYKHLWANDSTWLSLYILPLSPSTRDLAVAKLLHIAFRVVSGLRRHGVSTTLKRVRFKLAPLFQLRSVAVGRSARATDRQTPESSTPGVRMHYPDLADQCLDVRRRAVDAAFHAASGRVTSSR